MFCWNTFGPTEKSWRPRRPSPRKREEVQPPSSRIYSNSAKSPSFVGCGNVEAISLPAKYFMCSFIRSREASFLFYLSSSLFRLREQKDFRKRRRRKSHLRNLRMVVFLPVLALLLPMIIAQDIVGQNIDSQSSPATFYEEPQPLVYLFNEAGSGEGPSTWPNNRGFGSYQDSSSVSPSLITAKCWNNNYENDNDCKHLNVLTAPSPYEQNPNQIDEDSIITPIVIFESTSSIDPDQPPAHSFNNINNPSPQQKTPPYLPTFVRPPQSYDTNQQYRPTTANDVYAAPPAGATHLPPPASDNDQGQWQQLDFEGSSTTQSPVVSMPSNNIFVATPRPKKPPKTTTAGRKCQDENDADCDEPEDNNPSTDGQDEDEEESRVSSLNPSINLGLDERLRAHEMSSGDRPIDDNDDDGDDDGEDNVGGDDDDTGYDESGLNGGDSDNSNGDDDDDDDDTDDGSSGTSDINTGEQINTPRYVDVITEPIGVGPSKNFDQVPQFGPTGKPASNNGAEIEVVVHPTMPPSFPTATPTSTVAFIGDDMTGSGLESDSTSAVVTTFAPTLPPLMPDDTFKSKPVFPSTTQPEDSFATEGSSTQKLTPSDQDGDNAATAATPSSTTELDLATFKPVPMPPIEPRPGQPRRPPQTNEYQPKPPANESGFVSADAEDEKSDQSAVADRHKFVANSPAPPPSSNQVRPMQPSSSNTREQQRFEGAWREKPIRPTSNDAPSWANPQSMHHQRPGTGQMPSDMGAMGPGAQPRAQSEMLSTMLLYASFVILAVIASIFCLVVFTYWRRNNMRQMQKAALMHGSGRPPPGQHMIGSMSHGSQLLANIQQPGLLSTYAPGKGLSMGKVTTSLAPAKMPDESQLIVEEDEDKVNHNQLEGHSDRPNGGSSWSTSNEEQQTTVSSGSQQTNDSQQPAYQAQQQQQRAPPLHQVAGGQNRLQFPNSLSDGRQNSGSITDSQASSIESDPRTVQPQQQPYPINGYMPQTGPQQPNVYDPNMQPPGQAPYNQSVMQDVNMNGNKRFVAPSHSMEQLDQQPRNDHSYIPYTPAPRKLMDNRQHSLQEAPMHRGVYLPSPQNGSPPVNRLQFGSGPGQLVNQFNPLHLPPNSSTVAGSAGDNYLMNGNQPPQTSRLGGLNHNVSMDFNGPHFNAGPISPARVALNPLATLSRRYPPGMGLNRNIYSEDSSSLMTASPSLVRTSSSSSFAFNGSQHPTPTSIKAKPMVDPAGRVFNDYTQQVAGPPVLGRKDRSEAWYV